MSRRGMVLSCVMAASLLLGSCSSEDSASTDSKGLIVKSSMIDMIGIKDLTSIQDRQQEAVAKCMKQRGWDYTPVSIKGIDETQFDPAIQSNDLFSAEYRNRWGYGISTVWGTDGKMLDRAPGHEVLDVMESDPNAEYVAKLSTEEKGRYYTDLLGRDPSAGLATSAAEAGVGGTSAGADPNGAGSVSDVEGGNTSSGTDDPFASLGDGCAGKAVGLNSAKMTRLQQISTKLEEGSNKAGLDDAEDLASKYPKLRSAENQWSTCMTSAGYNFKQVADARDSIEKRFSQLGGNGGLGISAGDSGSDSGDAGSDVAVSDPSEASDAGATGAGATDAGATDAGTTDSEASPDVTSVAPAAATDAGDTGSGDSSGEVTPPIGDSEIGRGFDPATVDTAKIKKLQTDEVKQAQADYKCQIKGYRQAYIASLTAAQEAFSKKYADELKEMSQLLGVK